MRESDLLSHIYQRSAGLAAAFGQVVVGPGDDCAVIRTPGGDEILLTTDQLVEGRHYEPGTPIDLIARKAIARSVSDIAAMGGTPTWSLATACLPRGYKHADELFDAMHRWAKHWGCPLVGGDIAAFGDEASPVVLGVTVGGILDPMPIVHWWEPSEHEDVDEWCRHARRAMKPILRSGAEPGDLVFVTGCLGGAIRSGRHLTFEPRLKEGQLAAWPDSGVTAMIDLSDGLGRDAGRLARASGVVLELTGTRIPVSTDAETWHEAVRDGEDYELLVCGSDFFFSNAHDIGHVRALEPGEAPGVWVTDAYGQRHEVSQWGWDHE
ncbi:MAG: thiamine-monophosphate kinase [Phycisphaerales bacterium]|nr:thiamine-monophosphate kinase [Phycisphaerales bacterium]